MLLAAFEPGQEMAIANFFLAIFCIFTILLPLLLITRGDKTEANQDFITATVNPWSQIGKELDLTRVIVSEIDQRVDLQSKLETSTENNNAQLSESEEIISIEIKRSEELEEELSPQLIAINDEVVAA